MNFDYICLNRHPEYSNALYQFFQDILLEKYDQWFHPHPFTKEYTEKITTYTGKDLYYAMISANTVIGYGMLRGWDEGYTIPSLGIAMHPQHANKGYGKIFMGFLHFIAKANHAPAIRLTVYITNTHAINLYSNLGYKLSESEDGTKYIGILDFSK